MSNRTKRWTAVCAAGLTLTSIAAEPAARPEPATRPTPATRPAPATPTTLRAPATTRAVATRPVTSRPAASRPARAADPVRDTIAALFREATDAAKAGKPFPHPEGDALAGRTDLPELRTIEALDDRQSPDPRVDAYVKLNLISVFDRFDPTNATAAIRAYALGAPPLAIYPSVDAHERQDWERKVGQVNSPEAVERVNQQYEEAIARVAERNELMLRYRDLLRAKITAGDEATSVKLFAAQLEDLAQRSALGIDTDKLLTPLAKQIDEWSEQAGRASLRQMIAAVNEYASRRGPPVVFTKMSWSDKTRKARWGERDAALDQTKLKKLLETLREREKAAK